MSPPDERLDSWKAIADYLGRDVRTLRRWEEAGLPVRRVAGPRGRSVFAFKTEIDAWLKAGGADKADGAVDPEASAPADLDAAEPELTQPEPVIAMTQTEDAAGQPSSTRRSGLNRWALAASVTVIAIVALAWRSLSSPAGTPASIEVENRIILVRDVAGRELWHSDLPGGWTYNRPPRDRGWVIASGAQPAVYVATTQEIRERDQFVGGGAVRRFNATGTANGAFTFDDHVAFGGAAFDQPWVITGMGLDERGGARRLAISAHHITWWPSVVTILDDQFARHGTFVNPGWVATLRWQAPDRLLISGINQERDGGMVALLDANALDGAAPADTPTYTCGSCGPGRPLVYVVLPRSELNRVTGSKFNSGWLEASDDNVLVRTDEIDHQPGEPVAEAVYTFTPSLDLVSVSYGDRYWDRHRALEAAGKITHTREQCPERSGPPAVQVWDPAHGWRTIKTAR